MKDRPDERLLREVQEFHGLPSAALVEKDWHVVRALSAIHDVSLEGMGLAFGGGTALGRAHRLIKRMSEDIDFRIVGAEGKGGRALTRFRQEVTRRLEAAGFDAERRHVDHRDTYVRYDLPYAPIIKGDGVLRPEIKIELSAGFPVRRPTIELAVSSFVAEARRAGPELVSVRCVSLVDTGADKFVGLARRAGKAYSRGEELDPTLVRHVYDLHCLRGACDLNDLVALAVEVMDAEKARGAEAYQADPMAETLAVIAKLSEDKLFVDGYGRLMDDMVFGDKPSFGAAWGVVTEICSAVVGLKAEPAKCHV
ncbi:nucleotidyl transferase AbiEii/AbiGii toxin family protein [Caulobacter segnis]|uniref:nucleotidyl transferase AbiEii/AbiGii toxin family protein n=1 Tax=Caulobacter segnis TaxID=88688 RepID=UPI00240F734B|nr:nucleotidyl transferase AbiEii/AbiGii toxin family protein [Caulobacter segnis]MDG2522963.1 nucleotidyl transferase AbiEii/AbiGii toxin family protein [Caulobacter segnis]